MRRNNIIPAATILQASVGIATPAIPMPNPYNNSALPPIFTTFMTMEALMEILELPTLLKSAEPALDMAMNGMDATTII